MVPIFLNLPITLNVMLKPETGTMKASLLVSSQTSKIDDLEDVAARPIIRPIIWKDTGYHRQFMVMMVISMAL